MLTRIKLENFKSWRSVELDLAPLTLLFGTNSSGKTAILQSLLLLKQTANNFDRKQHINFGRERDYVDLGSWRDLVFGHDEKKKIGIRINSRGSDSGLLKNAEFVFGVRWGKNEDIVFVDKLEYSFPDLPNVPSIEANRIDNNKYLLQLPANWQIWARSDAFQPLEPVESNIIDTIENFYNFPQGLSIYNPQRVPVAFDTEFFTSVLEQILDRIDYLGPVRESPTRTYLWTGSTPQTIGPRGENTITALLASERQETQLISKVARQLAEADLAYEFRIEPIDQAQRFYETRIKITEQSVYSSLLDVGFGVSQVLPVITLLFLAPEGSIILLEQPELHLHPNAQAHLADLLLHVAETRHLQLIVESHSEHLLRRLQRRIAETEYQFATPENIKMYFCTIEEGESKAHPVEVDQYGQINNWPENFFGDITGDLEAMTRAALHKVMNGGERR